MKNITLRDENGSFKPENGIRVTKEHGINERNWKPFGRKPAAYTVVLTGSIYYEKNCNRWVVQWDNGFETILKDGDRICR